jgi:hypothetical protein
VHENQLDFYFDSFHVMLCKYPTVTQGVSQGKKKHEAIQKMEYLWDLMFCKHTSKYTKKNLGGFCIVKESTLQGEAPN